MVVTIPNSMGPMSSCPVDLVSPEDVDIVTISPSTVTSCTDPSPTSAARTDEVLPEEIGSPSRSKRLTVAVLPTFWVVTTVESSMARASPGKYDGSSRSKENNTL